MLLRLDDIHRVDIHSSGAYFPLTVEATLEPRGLRHRTAGQRHLPGLGRPLHHHRQQLAPSAAKPLAPVPPAMMVRRVDAPAAHPLVLGELVNRDLYDWYCERGQAENLIKDFKRGIKADRLSCSSFIFNFFSLLLYATACHLLFELRTAAWQQSALLRPACAVRA